MRIGIACEEHHGHFTVVTRLIDQASISAHDWLDGILEHCRSWHGLSEGSSWYKFDPADANDLRPIVLDGQRFQPLGFIKGQPLRPEAGMWRKILFMFCHAEPRPDVVVLVRDMDGYPKRREGMLQARDGLPWPFPVVIAAPQPEIEAWEVSAFSVRDDEDVLRLAEVQLGIGFDPTLQSQRLTSHPNDADADAKRIRDRLYRGIPDRREQCMSDTATLRARGSENGLVDFLNEIDERLLPGFSRPAQR